MHDLTTKYILASLAAVAGFSLSVVLADDTPRPSCAAISSRLHEVPLPAGLSQLTTRERKNVSLYLEARRGSIKIPPARIFLFRGSLPWEPEPNLSLIFQTRTCELTCNATAVVSDGNQARLIEFAYRKNLVGEPNRTGTAFIDRFQQRQSTAYIFLHSASRDFIAFFDVQQLPADASWTRETLRKAQSIRSEFSVLRATDRPASYEACLKNLSEVEGFIPEQP